MPGQYEQITDWRYCSWMRKAAAAAKVPSAMDMSEMAMRIRNDEPTPLGPADAEMTEIPKISVGT